ncbi:hypothetical protein IWQ56_001715, partial [Coemansia nantahalensis]
LTELYPLSLGRRVQLADREVIVVSAGDRLKQRFFSHAEPTVTVAELDSAKFRRDRWPPALDALLSARTADSDSLISGAVVRLADGFLVTLSVSHLITDGVGIVILLQQWAALAATGAAAVPVDYDHPGFWKRLTAHPADVHPYVAYTAEQDYGPLDGIRARLGTLHKTGSLDGKQALGMRVFHVSGDSIARLAARHNTDPGERPLHGAQLMYALLWQRYVAAVLGARPTETGPHDAIFLNLMHNVRGLVGAEHYVGNAVGTVFVPSTIEELRSLSVSALARKIKPFVNSVTPGATVDLYTASADTSSEFVLKATLKMSTPEACLTISNISRLPFLEIDFGLGAPMAVLCGMYPIENMAIWLPNRSGGVDIHFGLKDDVYAALRADEVLAEYVQFTD